MKQGALDRPSAECDMIEGPQSANVYSHSRLSCYEQCPRRYQYRYVDKVEVDDVQGIEAFAGNMVHLSLQHLHGSAAKGHVLSSAELIEHFDTLWEDHYDSSCVRIVRRGVTCSDHRMAARTGLQAYHRRHHPFAGGEIVGLEHELRFVIGERHQFIGFIDMLRSVGDGVYEIHDFKTGRRLPSSGEVRADRQLALYEIGVRQNVPDVREVRLKWHYLSHDKELTSSRTFGELQALEARVSGLIDDIEAADSFQCRSGPLCRWCEFEELCEK